ncbi:MAG TPA: ABC transporter permease subunit [Acidimicrobiales bacterium]|nr:ABC transporter permease subunit [Acidimicrobiales bacterium]
MTVTQPVSGLSADVPPAPTGTEPRAPSPRRGRHGRRARISASRFTGAARGLRFGLWALAGLFVLAPCACFLVLSVSPRLFDQGPQWFTLSYLTTIFTGTTAVSLLNSLWVSAAAAAIGIGIGLPVAWLAGRTSMPGRRFVPIGMWLVLLLPSWLPGIGWERLVVRDGVLTRFGLGSAFVTHAIMGPVGVVLVLGLRCVPFAFLTITASLAGLGQEFEDAARVHGASRFASLRLVLPILAPAIWSALAIGFAESISDFGVAYTLAYNSHFSLATYQLYAAIGNFPPSFPAAAAIGVVLVASVALPLALQAKALRGRSYAVLSARTRQAVRRQLSTKGAILSTGCVALFYALALGAPAVGAVTGSLLADFGASTRITFANYSGVLHIPGVSGPIYRSLVYGIVTATVTVVAGFLVARLLSRQRTRATAVLDFLLLATVALPGVVFAAGYIFAYNLPFLSRIGVDLYQTVSLLIIGYIASSLPTNARVLVGPVSQVQSSLHDAARAHGAGAARAWLSGVLPAVSRPLVMAWLFTFCGIFLELPISQLLYAPGSPPLSVAINLNLAGYHFGLGLAQAVIAVGIALGVVGAVLLLYRLLAPRGWRRIGSTVRG